MAQPADTFSSYDAIGNREDLADIIYDISPDETPLLSAIPKVSASATYHEHQKDALAAAGANAVIEGDDATTDAQVPTVRVGNYTQISDKVVRVTGTQEAVNKAGRGSDLAYNLMKAGKELKLDMEYAIFQNGARVAGDDSTARQLAGINSWIATNDDFGGTGASPTGDGTDGRTDGTQRAFAEADLQTVLASCWEQGGNPDTVFVGSFNKQAMSAFTGNATRNIDSADKKLVNAIDIYIGDFGELQVVPARNMRSRDCLVLDTDMWALAELRSFSEKPLAKTGDSERTQLLCEYTLEARNEASSGGVYDLTTS